MTTAPRTTATTFFYRGSSLLPVRVPVDSTASRGPGSAALTALLAGPPAGFRTAIPAGTSLESVTLARGTATASFNRALGRPTRSAQAQIVYTLTQLRHVDAVAIRAGGRDTALSNGAGEVLGRPATRADYVDLTRDALIFVATPERDSAVSSPVRVAGTASVFEATLALEVWSGGRRVRTVTITATRGAPERGRWSTVLRLPPGPAKLVLYEPSAENGSHLHTTQVFLDVRP